MLSALVKLLKIKNIDVAMRIDVFLIFITTPLLQIPFYLALGQKLGPKAARIFHGNYLYSLLGFIPLILIFLLYYFFLTKHKKAEQT